MRVGVRTVVRVTTHPCAGVSVSFCVCYSVLIWLCSQMTVPLYNMTLKCAKCGVISSADVSTTATSNAMLVPLIIFFPNSFYSDLWPFLCSSAPPLPSFLPAPSLTLSSVSSSVRGRRGFLCSAFFFLFSCSSSVEMMFKWVMIGDLGFRGVLCCLRTRSCR